MTKTLIKPEINDALEGFLADYETAGQVGSRDAAADFAVLRDKGIEHLRQVGLPKTSQEEWRFTSVASLARTRFALSDGAAPVSLADYQPIVDLTAIRFVFVNGTYRPELSSTEGLPEPVKAGSFKQARKNSPELFERHLGTANDFDRTPFSALNAAMMDDGFFLFVPAGEVVTKPIHALFLASSAAGPTVSHPRSLIIAEENSQVTLLESYAGKDGEVYFTNSVTEFVVADGAVVDHYRLQEESTSAFHIAALDASEGRASNFSTQGFTFGGALVRNDIGVLMGGEGGLATMNGLLMIEGKQLVDNHTRIDHAEPHCETHEFFKGILEDQARGVFNGSIMVRQKAQKTNSKQTNRNLLLSKEALINTNPQLEIFADDVKCTHGATIGQLDETALYYFRTRGIKLADAKRLLTYAFANELIERVKLESLQKRLQTLVTVHQESSESRHRVEA